MRAIIHIGTEKTGTSTIQNFLNQNRDLLPTQKAAFLRSPGLRNNRKLVTYCMDIDNVDDHVVNLDIRSEAKRKTWQEEFKLEFTQELKALDPSISTVIISSEQFQSRLTSKTEVENLLRLLAPHFDEIKILVYLRRQDQVAVSLYSTWCRVGGSHKTILDQSISANDPYYNYYDLIERWGTVFGIENMIIRVFDRNLFVGGDLLRDFFDATDLQDSEDFVTPENTNEKLSAQLQNVLILFNRAFPYYVDDKPAGFNNDLRAYILKESENKYKGKEKLPTRKEALDFYGKFAESNSKLAHQYLSSETIFSDDFSKYPETLGEGHLEEDVVSDVFGLTANFMNNFYILPKNKIDRVDVNDTPDIIFQQIASAYGQENPAIQWFLLKVPFLIRRIDRFSQHWRRFTNVFSRNKK